MVCAVSSDSVSCLLPHDILLMLLLITALYLYGPSHQYHVSSCACCHLAH